MTSIEKMDLKGKRVFLRTDLNVPIANGELADLSRLEASRDTIECILRKGGACVLASHIGRPEGYDDKLSTNLLVPYLSNMLGVKIKFIGDCVGEDVDKAKQHTLSGEVLLLENLRFHRGEYDNDEDFAKSLSAFCDVFINDAFATSHRSHASLVGIIQYFGGNVGIGVQMERELDALDRILTYPKSPFTLVVGGSKVCTKIGLLKSLATRVDNILIGGAMANTFIHVLAGSNSSCASSRECITAAKELLEGSFKEKIYLPSDGISPCGSTRTANDSMLDIGEGTRKSYSDVIKASKTVIWNGPMGMFENEQYAAGTVAIANAIADSDAFSIFGGGDTLSAVNKAGVPFEKFSFVSTGGGALLYAIENNSLPAIKTLHSFRS